MRMRLQITGRQPQQNYRSVAAKKFSVAAVAGGPLAAIRINYYEKTYHDFSHFMCS